MRGAAFNTGPEFHALDHIAPLAECLNIPLIVTEEKNEELARRYYPQVSVRLMENLELRLGEIAREFDILFECKYWAPHLKSLFRTLYSKEMKLVFCPHGQSDKGYQAPLLDPYASQDAILVYGELLIQMLKELAIWPSINQFAKVGNYRLQFYRKHQTFYDDLAAKEVPLDQKKRTLLYAPTWRDADSATSFFQWAPKVIAQLPSDWNLILKLHPLLEQRDPAYFYSIASLADRKKNVFLVDAFPPVYPLLSLADVYLGDASSIGYDFLYFKKPFYFFPTAPKGRLYSCGRAIDPEKNIYSQFDQGNPFEKEQASLYQYAFGLEITEEELRRKISSFLKGEPQLVRESN